MGLRGQRSWWGLRDHVAGRDCVANVAGGDCVATWLVGITWLTWLAESTIATHKLHIQLTISTLLKLTVANVTVKRHIGHA